MKVLRFNSTGKKQTKLPDDYLNNFERTLAAFMYVALLYAHRLKCLSIGTTQCTVIKISAPCRCDLFLQTTSCRRCVVLVPLFAVDTLGSRMFLSSAPALT